MPRSQGDKTQNNFIKGLITEKNVLSFPQDACSETFNCIFDEKGRTYRRPGINQEVGGTEIAYTTATEEAFTEFLWTNVGGIGTSTFLLQQVGGSIFVYNVSTSEVISTSTLIDTVTLTDFLPEGSSFSPVTYPCQYAKGNGTVIVTSSVLDPFYLDYDFDTSTLVQTEIEVEVRDFEGLEDGVNEYTRQTSSVAAMITSNPEFMYNLYNQGWSQSDALTQWDAALTTLPSHRDVVSLYRSSQTDAFDSALITSVSPGTTRAPKGHFILKANSTDRAIKAGQEGITLSLGEGTPLTAVTDYSFTWRVSDTNLTEVNEGTTNRSYIDCTRNASSFSAIGSLGTRNLSFLTFNLLDTRTISKLTLYGSNDRGLIYNDDYGFTINGVTAYLYGGSGAAPDISAGTVPSSTYLLGSASIPSGDDQSAGVDILNTVNPEGAFDWVVLTLSFSYGTPDNFYLYLAELDLYSNASTYNRPSTTCFFQGRAWYAGYEANQLSSSVFFSQIIENKNQYGRCYQKQDPTNEYFNELLVDDGGVIRILEIERIVKIFSTQSSVIILATNGVWEVTGNPYFTATNYNVRKMSSVGCFSPLSVVDYKGLPIWWGEDGIYTIQFDPQFQTFQIVNLTEDRIKEFYLDIPSNNRVYAKGVYDLLEDTCYWVYNTTESFVNTDKYIFNAVLCLNRRSIAFYPWTFSDTNYVRGVFFHNPVLRTVPNTVKYVYTDPSSTEFSYANFYDTIYLDWGADNYESYFVSGYDINQTALKFASPNYVQVYLDDEEIDNDPSAYIQGVYDFTTSSSLGRWSVAQQVYPSSLNSRKASFRKLKIRGKGKSLQFKIYSEEGKPFYIVGWSSAQNGNANV